MCVKEKYWETQQNFDKIQTLCLEKCRLLNSGNREYITYWEGIVGYCAQLLLDAREMSVEALAKEQKFRNVADRYYQNGFSYKEVMDSLHQRESEEKKEQAKKENINKALHDGYDSLCYFMADALDYPLYEKKARFESWKQGKNPYETLQNIGKNNDRYKFSLFETAHIFQKVLYILRQDIPFDRTTKALNQLLFSHQ